MPTPLDKYTLYEHCAQHPSLDSAMIRAIHADLSGKRTHALTLGEDFSGHAALSLHWCRSDSKSTAVAVDHDPEALIRATKHPRIRHIEADVMSVNARVDAVAVLNFSIGEIHDRRDLVRYLRHARARLRTNGCFIADLYGGADAFTPRSIRATTTLSDRRRVVYRWEQRDADPLSATVVNAMHFTVYPPPSRSAPKKLGVPELVLRDAFVYHWRLWSPSELADALRDAGFRTVEFYSRSPGAVDSDGAHYAQRLTPDDMPESFNIFVAARK
jgi:hypothetical protein